ncbi:MAG: hypothetical protein QOG71_3211 [Pyrinomonadaceae bacterium]|nr:hypothetical protein [Pyrinomonadaceae bacterium]
MIKHCLKSVKPWSQGTLSNPQYDALIAVVGYEQRSNYVASVFKHQSKRLFASAFDERKEHAYKSNLHWFEQQGFEVKESTDIDFKVWCEEILNKVDSEEEDNPIRICVDISSISRFRLAILMASICKHRGGVLEVDFLYAPAKFSPPNYQEGPIVTAKPVIDMFAGWTTEPAAQPVAIFGLGYERDKAVGVIEYIEPIGVWAFKPHGEDTRYDIEVTRANKTLRDVVPNDHLIEYAVDRPFECFTTLESLIYGTFRTARPILIPFGPKIFSLCCLLVACTHFPRVSVWRVSSGQYDLAVDRIANGKIVGLKAEFGPQTEMV